MLEPQNIPSISKVFPNLTSFGYEGGGYRERSLQEPTPRELWSEVLHFKSTLKVLRLQYDEERYMPTYSDRLAEEDLMGSLSCMEALETLQIHARHLYQDYMRNEPPDYAMAGVTMDEHEYYRQSIAKDRIRRYEEATRDEEAQNLNELTQANEYGGGEGVGEDNDWQALYFQNGRDAGQEGRPKSRDGDDGEASGDEVAAEANYKRDDDDNRRLVSFLPKSIRKLTIIDFTTNEMGDVVELLQAAGAMFPKLAEVSFPGIDQENDNHFCLLEDCEYYGIKCTFEAAPFSKYGAWVV